jgi:hypothetical protein
MTRASGSPFLDCPKRSDCYACSAPLWKRQQQASRARMETQRLCVTKTRWLESAVNSRPHGSPAAAGFYSAITPDMSRSLPPRTNNIAEHAVIAREIRKRAAIAKQPSKYDGISTTHNAQTQPLVAPSPKRKPRPRWQRPGLGSRCRRGWVSPDTISLNKPRLGNREETRPPEGTPSAEPVLPPAGQSFTPKKTRAGGHRQKFLNRSAASSLYLTVCRMCPRYACNARVSWPALAKA